MSRRVKPNDREVVSQFVAFLSSTAYPDLRVDRIPEDEHGDDPPIDAIAGVFAIEHTSIDTAENQRRDSAWFMTAAGDLEAELRGQIPYRLSITLPYDGIGKGQNWSELRSKIRHWALVTSATVLDGRHSVRGVSGVPFDFWADKSSDRKPGIVFSRTMPDTDDLPQRVAQLLSRKAEKLRPYRDNGSTTLLLVESEDIALMNHHTLVEAIRSGLGKSLPSGVDRIWYADTGIPSEIEFEDITSACLKP